MPDLRRLTARRGGRVVTGLLRVTLDICRSCLDGYGTECHTPGCAFWMQSVPDLQLALKPDARLSLRTDADQVKATGS